MLAGEPGQDARLDRVVVGGDQVVTGRGDQHSAQDLGHGGERRGDPVDLAPLEDQRDHRVLVADRLRPGQVLELRAAAGPAAGARAVVHQVVAQAAVGAGARPERAQLRGARLRRFGADLERAPGRARQVLFAPLEQLGDRELVEAARSCAPAPAR